MVLEPLEGYRLERVEHCVTGSMERIYGFNEHDVSEEMLLGLGAGVGFVYWHAKGTDPFLGGRARGRPGQGFESLAGERTGVVVREYTTSSARKAESGLVALLDAGQPVMLQVDMGMLPYFDFGGYDYHFGAHMVVAFGYDPESRRVLLADRDKDYHQVSVEVLESARGSTYKPFPPKRRWYTFDFAGKRPPTPADVHAALREQVEGMIEPAIANLGVKGIRKAAKMVLRWPDAMDEEALRRTLYNGFISIDAKGGTGGGLFRFMFSHFLREAAAMTGHGRLEASAGAFHYIGKQWQDLAEVFERGWNARDTGPVLEQASSMLSALADAEEPEWEKLAETVPV